MEHETRTKKRRLEEGSEETESRCGQHKRRVRLNRLMLRKNDLESSTGGEFDDIIRSLIDEGVVLSTVRTSKRKICTKLKNIAPSSPQKNKPDKNRKWFNGLTNQGSYWCI